MALSLGLLICHLESSVTHPMEDDFPCSVSSPLHPRWWACLLVALEPEPCGPFRHCLRATEAGVVGSLGE